MFSTACSVRNNSHLSGYDVCTLVCSVLQLHAVCSLCSLQDCNLCIRSTVMRDSVWSVRGRQAVDRIDWPSTYRVPTTCNPAAVCPIHLSLAGQVTEEQLTAPNEDHGHEGRLRYSASVSSKHYIASDHCAQRASLLSAEFELTIRVSPRSRIFGASRPRQSADL